MFNHRVIVKRRRMSDTENPKSTSLLPKNYLREFSSITSLHGIMYLGEPRRPLLERVYWLCVMSLVMSLCSWQIYQLYSNWSNNRMIMTMNTKEFNINSIPFPAITFCNDLQLQNINTIATNDNETNDAINMLCYKFGVRENETLKYINYDKWQRLIKNHKLSCTEMISKLHWLQDEVHSPCDYIQPSLTSYGLCYSLNMVPHRHLYEKHYLETMALFNRPQPDNVLRKNESIWTPENRYSKNATPFDIPWRVTGDTIENTVRLEFNLKNTHPGGHCPDTDPGLTLIVHNPADTPIGMIPTAYVTHNNILSISLTTTVVHTSPKITNWPPKSRNCYFHNEKPLKFFQIYTLHNCNVECRANNTLKKCGCNAYFQPKDAGVPVCGSKSSGCVRKAMTIGYSVFDKQPKANLNNMDSCECLPACVDIQYNYETVEFFKSQLTNSSPLNQNGDKSMVVAYYKRKFSINLLKSSLLSFNELLGYIGGLFGLFLGCSIVSFFEIIYFFVIRLYFIQRDRRIAKSKNVPNIIIDE